MTRTQAFVLWAILVVGLIAGSLIPDLSPPSAKYLDLVIHLGVYLALAALPAVLFGQLRLVISMAVLLAVIGFGIEVAQSYVPGRMGSELDLFANCLGIILGVAAGRLLQRYVGLREQ